MSLIISPYNISPYSIKDEVGNAFSNDQYIEFGATKYINYAAPINLGKTHSVFFWAKIASGGKCYPLATSVASKQLIILHNDDNFYYGDDNELVFAHPKIVRDNTWKLYGITRADNTVRFYYDNVEVGSGKTLVTNGDFIFDFIGRYNTNYSDSPLDQIVIYNKVLSASEMTALYGGGTPQTSGNPQLISGLIHYLNFEQTITTIKDVITDEVLTQNNMLSGDIKTY